MLEQAALPQYAVGKKSGILAVGAGAVWSCALNTKPVMFNGLNDGANALEP